MQLKLVLIHVQCIHLCKSPHREISSWVQLSQTHSVKVRRGYQHRTSNYNKLYRLSIISYHDITYHFVPGATAALLKTAHCQTPKADVCFVSVAVRDGVASHDSLRVADQRSWVPLHAAGHGDQPVLGHSGSLMLKTLEYCHRSSAVAAAALAVQAVMGIEDILF